LQCVVPRLSLDRAAQIDRVSTHSSDANNVCGTVQGLVVLHAPFSFHLHAANCDPFSLCGHVQKKIPERFHACPIAKMKLEDHTSAKNIKFWCFGVTVSCAKKI